MANKKYLDYEGLQHFKEKLDEEYALNGALNFKGTVATISALPTVSGASVGDMYNVTAGGTTTADFVEGAGQTLQDGENVVAVNVGTDADPEMKWDIIGGVLNIDDKLTYTTTMPLADPEDGDVAIYLGDTTYEDVYTEIADPEADADPSTSGWYERSGEGTDVDPYVYTASTDTAVDDDKTYYAKSQTEKWVQGVIYRYDDASSAWEALNSGDSMVAITNAEIDSLF